MFKLGDFDFGVDSSKSTIEVQGNRVSIEIWGEPESIERAWEDEDGPWASVLYPPLFYIRDVPCNIEDSGNFARRFSAEDYDEFEIGLYMLEHFDLEPCIVVKVGRQIRVTGTLPPGLQSHPLSVEIQWHVGALEESGTKVDRPIF